MSMIRPRALGPLALAAVTALAAAACGGGGNGGGGSGGSGGTVVLGTTLSLSGALGVLGAPVQAGYEQAVADINASGGITVNGAKEKVKLVVLDNGSDPNKASSQARELVLKDNAVALLGFTTPPIVTPTALAAEQLRVPFVTSLTPVEAFAGGSTSGWKYSWDFFFDEKAQAEQAAKALASVKSNKKVVLFTDNEPDGVLERPLYKAAFAAAGLDVVGDYSFPVGTTDFSSFISSAKAQGAQLLGAQMTPADGVALWKQLKSFNFAPQAAFVAKASDANYWWETLGTMAQDSLSEGFWSSAGVQSSQLEKVSGTLGKKFGITSGNMGAATMAYTAAEVLAQAIAKADGTDPDKVNTAIGQTNGDFPGGHIQFSSSQHTSVTPYYVTQWQGGKLVQVMPPAPGITFAQPTAGLG
jgi:branched-chain amino acid transport system substrate-binding protein